MRYTDLFLSFKKFDWLLFISVLLLCVVGLVTIYSIDSSGLESFKKQFIFVLLGIGTMLALSLFDYRVFKNHSSVLISFYIFSIVLLIVVLFFGYRVHGTMSWFRIGGVSFQPVELAKIALIFLLAKYLSLRHIEMYRFRHIVVSGIYMLVLVGLTCLQPDLGSVFVLVSIWLGIILVAGIKMRHLLILGLIAIVVATSGWFWFLKDYQKSRIISFMDPQFDPYGQGYNVVQSLIAVGSGSWVGHGLSQASQSQLNFLPEQRTDFIFAAFAEEWGFVGVMFLLSVYAILFWRLIKAALEVNNNFSKLFISGFIIMMFFHLIINIGMNMSVLPIVGLPLSFISYGGSNLIVSFIALGVIQSMRMRS